MSRDEEAPRAAGRKREPRMIGEYEFTMTQLLAKDGRPLLWKLGQIAAPILDQLLSRAKNGGAKAAAGTAAIRALLNGVEFDLVEEFADKFGKNCKAKSSAGVELDMGTPALRDAVFGTRYLDYFEWIAFGIEVNFADFFREGLERLGKTKADTEASQ